MVVHGWWCRPRPGLGDVASGVHGLSSMDDMKVSPRYLSRKTSNNRAFMDRPDLVPSSSTSC